MGRWLLAGLFLLTFTAAALADDRDTYGITYPAPVSPQPGELAFAAHWRIWLPPNVKTLRGIVVHQHGCGIGSCDSGYTGADDLHWRALAKKWDCALMAVSYRQTGGCALWCDPRNGSAKTFLRALRDFASLSGHAELETVPWILWGHSGGGQWVASMAHLYPSRVLAVWMRSGHPDTIGHTSVTLPWTEEFRNIPMIFNIGVREKTEAAWIWEAAFPYIETLRAKGGKVGIVMDPHTAHETGDSRYPAIHFLDECMAARLPDVPGSGEMKPIGDGIELSAEESQKLLFGKPLAEAEASETGEGETQVEKMAGGLWFPNAELLEAARRYSAAAEFDDATPPPAPTNVQIDDSGLMTWEIDADVESGLAGFVIRKGDEEILRLPTENRNPFGRPVYQGLTYSDTPVPPLEGLQTTLKDYDASKKADYSISALNTAGLESEMVHVQP